MFDISANIFYSYKHIHNKGGYYVNLFLPYYSCCACDCFCLVAPVLGQHRLDHHWRFAARSQSEKRFLLLLVQKDLM
jgi:hypothetical protein